MKRYYLLLSITLSVLAVSLGGCVAIGALGSESASEMKNQAEYDVTKNKPAKLLVLVEQPANIKADANIRLYLTQFTEALMVKNLKLKPDTMVPYTQLAKFRSERADFEILTPVQIGKELGATEVLHIIIDDFGLYGLAGTGYYKANLDIRSGLYDVVGEKLLWPAAELKTVKVALDSQKGSYDKGALQLSQAAARCIIRCLYNSPRVESRVPEEVKDAGAGL